jgi:hypothetical protein
MTSCRIAAVVACRVVAVFVAVQSLAFLPTSASSMYSVYMSFPNWWMICMAVALAMPIILAAVVWCLAPWIASHMLESVENEQPSACTISMEDAHVIAFSVLGLLFVLGALPGVLVTVAEFVRAMQLRIAAKANWQSVLSERTLKDTITQVLQTAFGAWLFFGARRFVRLFQRFNAPNTDRN